MNIRKWMSLVLACGLGLNSAGSAFAAVGKAVSGRATAPTAAIGSAGAAAPTVPILRIQTGVATPSATPLPAVTPAPADGTSLPAAASAPRAIAPSAAETAPSAGIRAVQAPVAAAQGRPAASRSAGRTGINGTQALRDRQAVRAKVDGIGELVAGLPAARLSAADSFQGGVRIEDALTGARSHAGLGDVGPAMSAGLRARAAGLRAAAPGRADSASAQAAVPAPSGPLARAKAFADRRLLVPAAVVAATVALLAAQAYLPAAIGSLSLFALTGTVAREDPAAEASQAPGDRSFLPTAFAVTLVLGSATAAYVAASALALPTLATLGAVMAAPVAATLAWLGWRAWRDRRGNGAAVSSRRTPSASAAEWLARLDEANAADPELQAEVDKVQALMSAVQEEMAKVIINNPEHETMVRLMLLAAIGGENILLEALPGEGKTMTIRALAGAVDLPFSRIQFDPEKMPSDIKGAEVLEQDPETGRREFAFRKGPVFANIVLADEINRGTPKTQAAMLEAMAERQVTVGKTTYDLSQPFFVMATQNPVEQEGTYPLPEAQLDRFMFKYTLPQADLGTDGDRTQVRGIMELNRVGSRPEAQKVATGEDLLAARAVAEKVRMDESLNEYILNILEAAGQPARYGLSGEVKWMLSKRASIAIAKSARIRAMTEGRTYVVPADIRFVVPHILRHRIALAPGSRKLTTDALIREILDKLPVDPAAAAKLKSREAPGQWAARAAAGRKWLKVGLRWTGTALKWLALPALGLGLWWFGGDVWSWLTTQAPVLNDWAAAVKAFLQGSQAGR